MDITHLLARRLHELRAAKGWSLETLAARSGVSRSNISLIERGQSSPTAVVLDKLSAGLGVTVASLFEHGARASAAPPPPLTRPADQPLWTDPASGYVRRNLSPPGVGSTLQLVEVLFPPGRSVAYETGAREPPVHQQVWMLEGTMDLTLGDTRWRLLAGDCLAMTLDRPLAWRNPTRKAARYLVALADARLGSSRRPA